jgi:predicted secreted hydrolase
MAHAETWPLQFPRDFGAHPDTRIEWWYVTGWANTEGAQAALGFQVTFFRARIDSTQAMRSSLAARQLLFAHAAVTDVRAGALWHDQRIARWSGAPAGGNVLDMASASEHDTAVVLKDWSLVRKGESLVARIAAPDFAMDLQFDSTQPVLLQGENGLSRKSPQADHTSYYYSLPHLRTQGRLVVRGKPYTLEAGSTAWLDHEWSQNLMHPQAVGWDWMGINLFDGCALTLFRLRTAGGDALWHGGSLRCGKTQTSFGNGDLRFAPLRHWTSPLSQARYPVEWNITTPTASYTVRAVVDAQELDSRQSTGALYWEGLCEVRDSGNVLVGRGYLEMTGYASPLKL